MSRIIDHQVTQAIGEMSVGVDRIAKCLESVHEHYNGSEILDRAAIAAMQALIAKDDEFNPEAVAKKAYRYALALEDVML